MIEQQEEERREEIGAQNLFLSSIFVQEKE